MELKKVITEFSFLLKFHLLKTEIRFCKGVSVKLSLFWSIQTDDVWHKSSYHCELIIPAFTLTEQKPYGMQTNAICHFQLNVVCWGFTVFEI